MLVTTWRLRPLARNVAQLTHISDKWISVQMLCSVKCACQTNSTEHRDNPRGMGSRCVRMR
jgi:hypothetical protein